MTTSHVKRRTFLNTAAALGLNRAVSSAGVLGGVGLLGCGRPINNRDRPAEGGARTTNNIPCAWVGADHTRGHRLRQPAPDSATAAVQRRAEVIIVGAGIAGLAAARAFRQRGVTDVHVLELEDQPGGNSRGHRLGGIACPLGAHYLPLPGPQAPEVSDWLHELGLLKTEFGRTVADERHLCHSPQERLFIDGSWADGLLPPADPGSASALQYSRFARAIEAVSLKAGTHSTDHPGRQGDSHRHAFSLPAHRNPWTATAQALNKQTFAHWLDAQGLDDPLLRWYLDYCCRDDYGASAATVSAWAGVHYFASRHGFADPSVGAAERDAVFTWPEGNAWLVQRLAAPLLAESAPRLQLGRTVLRVQEGKHGVQVLAWDEHKNQLEAWQAPQVVLALPLFAAARVLESPPEALLQAAALLYPASQAPWLVANLQLDKLPLDRPGAPPSWDNVIYGGRGLGYVDAMHQSLRSHAGATVITAYQALPVGERAALLNADAPAWADKVLQDLARVHPDINQRCTHIDLMRWGHAMAIPRPEVHHHPALQALRATRGRVRFAHADLAGYSVFEEAFTAGCEVAKKAWSGL